MVEQLIPSVRPCIGTYRSRLGTEKPGEIVPAALL
jgi:hypothetical protein